MKRLFALLLFCSAAALVSPAGAQPDKTESLAKAKAKFEQDISKAEDTLIASLDKARKSAAGNKQLAEKLAYERDQFANHRIIPTSVPTATYLKQRSQATTALEIVYRPAIKELSNAKKEEEAEALETALSDLIKTARGYGLAFPDLALRAPLIIENKATGLVFEPTGKDGAGEVVLVAKVGKRKPLQCWYLDRDEKGYTLVNAQTGRACFIFNRDAGAGEMAVTLLGTNKLEPQKEVPERFLFQLSEVRREVVFTSQLKGETTGRVFTASERKQKGVTSYEPTLAKLEGSSAASQRWLITEAK